MMWCDHRFRVVFGLCVIQIIDSGHQTGVHEAALKLSELRVTGSVPKLCSTIRRVVHLDDVVPRRFSRLGRSGYRGLKAPPVNVAVQEQEVSATGHVLVHVGAFLKTAQSDVTTRHTSKV